MHLLPNVAIQPNLELKTWPKQLLGSLPLDIAFLGRVYFMLSGIMLDVVMLSVMAPTQLDN